MNEKEKAFIVSLNSLMSKHGISFSSSDEYDGLEDEYTGKSYSFYGESIDISMNDLAAWRWNV